MAEPEGKYTLRGPASLEKLKDFQAFVLGWAKDFGLPAEVGGKLELVMEELAVNVINYAYPDGRGDLEIQCLLDENGGKRRFCVKLKDWGAPFDPLNRDTPDTEQDIEERPVGGLGIFLVREMSDSLDYEREGDANVLTFCFDLP